MATVYLARDLRHERSVAVKVFREALADSLGAERFLREIQIAAQLQHTHIVGLLDSGEAAGLLYYVMPFIDGETLRAKMRSEGGLAIDTAVLITREVADALAYAHRHGVIHRDIKPENILLADGHAFVADFGIARAMDAAVGSLTQTGLALGTPAYMAPEQVFGEKGIDARADLFALGCVLHEMLTGTPPYGGPTAQAMFLRRFTEAVPLLRASRPDVPDWLDGVVRQLLATEPANRPASAAELLEKMDDKSHLGLSQGRGGGQKPPRSIAVLPFTNMSADAENEYFADGISEELINQLAQFPSLKVIARTSSFSFKGKNVDVREIGRALGVGHIVEGSVRRAASTLRITTQLIDAISGSHLWSARYDRPVADAFLIQDEITAAVCAAVGTTLLGAAEAATIQTDQETYDLFLRGRALLLESSTRLQEAHALLERATERDANFIPALVALADSVFFEGLFAKPPRPAWQRVRELAQEISRRSPAAAAADRLIGTLHVFSDHDLEKAEVRLRQAVASSPNDVLAHGMLSLVLVANGRIAEADLHNRRSIALDPLGTFSHMMAANNWAVAGQLADAEAAASAVIEIDPRYPEGYHMRGYTRNYMGRFREAEQDLARVPGLGNRSGWPLAKRSIALAGLGQFDEVRSMLDQMLARSATEFMTPDAVACVHQLLGQNDEAFDWLRRAVDEQALWAAFVGIDPIFSLLRRDSRFVPFCQTHHLPVRPLPPSALDRLVPPE
jgi:serine/threonine-protein kinase